MCGIIWLRSGRNERVDSVAVGPGKTSMKESKDLVWGDVRIMHVGGGK